LKEGQQKISKFKCRDLKIKNEKSQMACKRLCNMNVEVGQAARYHVTLIRMVIIKTRSRVQQYTPTLLALRVLGQEAGQLEASLDYRERETLFLYK
jgi:hypothetical protein